MSYFHIVVFFNDYYTLIVAFLMKQIQNRYRYRRLPDFESTSNFTNVKACVLACKKSIVIVMYDSFKSIWGPPRGFLAPMLFENFLKTRWRMLERLVSCF